MITSTLKQWSWPTDVSCRHKQLVFYYPFLKIIGLLFLSLANFFPFSTFFHFVNGFLCCAKAFKFKLGPICLFLFLPLETETPKCCYNLCQRVFCLCFLLGILWFPFLNLDVYSIFVHDVRKHSTSSLYTWLLNFPITDY